MSHRVRPADSNIPLTAPVSAGSLLPPHFRRTMLTCAIGYAFAAALAAAVLPGLLLAADAPVAAEQAATNAYDIPAGPLEAALNRFGREAGVLLSFPTETAAGRQSQGLRGNYSVQQGLQRLLQDTGLAAVAQANGSYALAVAASVSAKDEPVTTLAEVSVTAEITAETAISPVRGFVAKRSAAGTKTDTPLLETPQSISVITRDEIDARGATSVTEAARYVPGVQSETYGSETRGYDWFTLRGFDGLLTSDYRDGLRQFGSNFTFPRTESYGLERIEIVRGPASLLFGQVDAGGIVHRVSKRPDLDAPNEIQLRLGSFDRKEINVDVGGALNQDKTLLYRLVGVGLDSDTQDQYLNGDKVRNERQYFAPSLTWNPSEDTSFTLLADIRNQRTPGFSFRYTDQDSGFPVITDRLVGDPDFTRFDQKQSTLGYQFEHRFNERWAVRQNLRAAHSEIDYRRVNDVFNLGGGNVVRTAAIFDDSVSSLVVDTQAQADFQIGDMEHKLLIGVDWLRADSKVRHTEDFIDLTFDADGNPVFGPDAIFDVNNPDYSVNIPRPTTPIGGNFYNEDLNQLGLYVQDQIKFSPRWVATFGGRLDQSDIERDDREAANQDTEQDDSAFSGRAGLTYLSPLGLAPYVSYAESFLPQSGTSTPLPGSTEPGKPFKPTEGKQYEIGIKYEPPGTRALITVALYDLTKTNVASFDAGFTTLTQIGEVNSRGIEIEGKATLMRGLNLNAALTYQDVRITESNNEAELGSQPFTVSEKLASAYLDYTFPEGSLVGLGFGFGARYLGPQFNSQTDQSGATQTPGFTLYDAAIHYDTGPWRLALNVANLTDKDYVANCAYMFCSVGLERTVLGTVAYRFD